jgi:Fe-S cluster assembly protein SufD
MADLRLTGIALLAGSQHADITAVADHAVRDGRSDLAFKSVLAGRARGVAQGRILVRPGADGTDSRQQTRALLLSPHAEADAKPELEIHAGDVTCGHGVAIGDLDADALFYLRSRGIPLPQARALLTEAFLEEALARLPAGPAAEAMRAFVLARLHGLEAAP